jgi:hypothetical protein
VSEAIYCRVSKAMYRRVSKAMYRRVSEAMYRRGSEAIVGYIQDGRGELKPDNNDSEVWHY